jgi:hypothetical protein
MFFEDKIDIVFHFSPDNSSFCLSLPASIVKICRGMITTADREIREDYSNG